MLPTDKNARSEYNRWCWIALALIIICSAIIRSRLAAMPLERDEGEYAYIAQQMLKGVPPYASAYSMKLPGIYAIYALILVVFGQTQTGIHLGLIVFNAATILVIFLLARRMFGGLAGVAAACAYSIMSWSRASLGLTANAEHFVLLPALIGILLVHKVADNRRYGRLLAAGLLTGLAFVVKQHGVFFAVFGALYLLYTDLRHRPVQWKKCIITQLVFAVGVLTPFVLVCLFFRQIGIFDKFWFWTFTYTQRYTTTVPLSVAKKLFAASFRRVITGVPLVWLLALLGLLMVIVRRRERVHLPFIIGFLIFSFLAVCPGLYFRGHYFILFFPAAAVVAGAGFDGFISLLVDHVSGYRRGLVAVLAGLAIVGISLFQQRLYLFELAPADVSRFFYDGNPFPESLEIAEYIKQHSRPDDTIAVIGSEPQIYFYSDRRAATRYIYTYPLMGLHDYAAEMQKEMIGEIESSKPELMVFVGVRTSWLQKPASAKIIFNWFEGYAKEFYDMAGGIEIFPRGRTIYRWDVQAGDYKPASAYWVTVWKRRH